MNSPQSTIEDATNILDTVQEAYIHLDGEFRFTFINRMAETLLGAPRADLIGKTPWEVHPESAGTPLEEGFRRAKAENRTVSFENYYEPWKRWYGISAMPDSSGGFVVHFLDISERKRVDEALRQTGEALAKAERHYRIIFNSGSDSVFVLKLGTDGLPGEFIEVNDNACRYLGYSREELLRLRVSDIDEHPDIPATMRRLLVEGHLIWEGIHVAKDGRRIPVEMNARICDLDGTPTMICSVRDISKRKDAEKRYREIFDGALEGICRISTEKRFIAANPAMARMLGYDSAQELISTISDTTHQLWLDPNDRERFVALLEEHGTARGFECQFKRKDETVIWVSINCRAVCGENGETLYYDGFVEDTTERRQAEKRLQAQGERFQGIVEHTEAGYFRIGKNGCYEDVNAAWLRMYGFTSRDEAIGLHFSAVQVPEDAAKAEGIVQALMRGEPGKSGEFSRLRRDGTVGYHSFSTTPVMDGDQVIGIEGFLIDISERKKAEQDRQQSDNRYRSLFDSMHEGVAVHRLTFSDGVPDNYILLDVNRRYEEIVGVKRDDVVNRQATDVYGIQDPPYLKEYASVVDTGTPLQFETHFTPMDRQFVISVAPIGNDLFATIFFDITEQRRTEEQYKLIAENAADVIWLWDLGKNRPVYVSPSVLRLRGFTPEEVTAQPLDQSMPSDTYRMIVTQTKERIAAVESGDETARIRANEVEYICRDGSKVAAERVTTLISDDQGKVRHILGVSRDISERKRIEDALRKSEERFSRAFQSSPAAITIVDLATGSYLDVNGAFEQITGYRRDEVIGRRWDELGLWADSPNRDEAVAGLARDGSLRSVEFRFRKKSGELGTGLISAELIDINGNPCAITATIDITERLQLENQLRQAQKLESVGRLAGGVAHDFNNLLTVINGYSGMLLEQLKVFDPIHPYVVEINNAGERAASLTKQLLAFSRKQVIEPRVFDLNTTIRQSAPMLQRLIGEDIALETHLDDSLGHVLADPNQIHQVIMNLAVNAMDAMPDGGRLDIETKNIEIGAEASTAEHPDPMPGLYVLLTVTDSGHGMDEITRHQIFEPFFTTKEVGRGTGLGLATVYGIIRQSGGFVDVRSEVGVGTTLKVYLPRTDVRPVPDKHGIGAASQRGNETILVVEDETSVRSFTVAALKRYGYHVIEASGGDEAIAVAEEHSEGIHLLLTDVIMPGMNGKVLSERLKKSYPDLKVLLTSGYTADAFADRGVIDPGDVLLHKPFAPEELARKVREVLTKPSLEPPVGN